jgi:hypothetical protein
MGDETYDGSVTIICNGTGEGEKKCEVGKEHAGEKWTDVLGWHQGEVTIDDGESVAGYLGGGLSIPQRDGRNLSARLRACQSGRRLMRRGGTSLRNRGTIPIIVY